MIGAKHQLRSLALWIMAPAWQVGIWHLVAECVAWQQRESMALVATSSSLHYGAIQLSVGSTHGLY